jgi:hypothetical protein
MTTPQDEECRTNSVTVFWARVRFDRERGYAPAGQVRPPPQPKNAPSQAPHERA